MRVEPALRRKVSSFVTALGLLVLVWAGPAAAHSDEGELTITRAEQSGPLAIDVEVGIVYEGDGHLAEDAVVTATLTGSDGATVGPVDLIRTSDTTSLYGSTIQVPTPGDWMLRVDSSDPEGTAGSTVTVAEESPATTTTAPLTTAAPSTVSDGPPPVTPQDELSAADETSSLSPAAVVGACLALAALVIGGAVVVAKRRREHDPVDASTGGGS